MLSAAVGGWRALGRLQAAVCALTFSMSAGALEIAGGVSVGGIHVGAEPLLAVSPFAGVAWRTTSGFLFEAHNMFSLVPGRRLGVYDRTAASLGYAWKTGKLGVGPSLSVFHAVLRPAALQPCRGGRARVHMQFDWFLLGPLGVSVSANLDWVAGTPRVLAEGPVVMVTAGPVLRLDMESK